VLAEYCNIATFAKVLPIFSPHRNFQKNGRPKMLARSGSSPSSMPGRLGSTVKSKKKLLRKSALGQIIASVGDVGVLQASGLPNFKGSPN
jgi:hypothetical protein